MLLIGMLWAKIVEAQMPDASKSAPPRGRSWMVDYWIIAFAVGFLLMLGAPYIAPQWTDKMFGWHEPSQGKGGFNGASFTSICRYCGKKILQDSQGGWF